MKFILRFPLIISLLAALAASGAGPAAAAQKPAGPFSVSARAVLDALPEQGMATFIITLSQQLDPGQILPGPLLQPAGLQAAQARAARSQAVIEALQGFACGSQAGILARANALRDARQVGRVTPLWIFNGLSVEATAAGIRTLASLPGVAEVRPDPDPDFPIIPLAHPSAGASARLAAGGDVQPNIALVNAPALWALGFTGQGVVIASLDSGVDGSHPDLVSSYRGGPNSWFDPYRATSVPYDPYSTGHGTHTMGIMAGGSASGPFPDGYGAIGMAPGVKWIAAKVFPDPGSGLQTLETNFHLALEWVLDPDGDPATPDGARVVNNSWGYNGTIGQCIPNFAVDITNLRLAGVLPVFSAGNGGLGDIPGTDGSPANNPGALAVGAIDNNSISLPLSARGPSACGTGKPFPALVAPGLHVLSSVPVLVSGQPAYATLTGTSMAAPHVSGAAALLLSAYPDLPLAVLDYVLTRGAFDLGETGPDIHTGYGRLDVLQSYQLASAMWGQPYRTYIGLSRLSLIYYLPVMR